VKIFQANRKNLNTVSSSSGFGICGIRFDSGDIPAGETKETKKCGSTATYIKDALARAVEI
jgi:hypothetical protein